MLYNIVKEYDYNGMWYTVYVNGQQISGFRDQGDANLFAKWYTDPNEDYANARQYALCNNDYDLRSSSLGGKGSG